MNYNKLENFIMVGASVNSLAQFPTPSAIGYSLNDVDLDPYTDLQGYTQRNRVRADVVTIEVSYNVSSESDLAYILNAIRPVWFYVRIKDKITQQYRTLKMYASSKKFNTYISKRNNDGTYSETFNAFTVTFVEQ